MIIFKTTRGLFEAPDLDVLYDTLLILVQQNHEFAFIQLNHGLSLPQCYLICDVMFVPALALKDRGNGKKS
jgi:hypothetical protein